MTIFSSSYNRIKKINSSFSTKLTDKNYISIITDLIKKNSHTNSRSKRTVINGLMNDLQEYIEITIYQSILEEKNLPKESVSEQNKLENQNEQNVSISTDENQKETTENINESQNMITPIGEIDKEDRPKDSNEDKKNEAQEKSEGDSHGFTEEKLDDTNQQNSCDSTVTSNSSNCSLTTKSEIPDKKINSTFSLAHNYNNHILPLFFKLIDQSIDSSNLTLNNLLLQYNTKPFNISSNLNHLVLKSLSISLLIYQHCNEQELIHILFFILIVSFNNEYQKVGHAVCEQIVLGLLPASEPHKKNENNGNHDQKITTHNLNTFSFFDSALSIVHNIPNNFISKLFAKIINLSPYKYSITQSNLFFDLKEMHDLKFNAFQLLIDMKNKGYSIHIDIDYLIFYYNKNEEIILKVLLNENNLVNNMKLHRDTEQNENSNELSKNLTLNNHIFSEPSDIIQLLPHCINNLDDNRKDIQLSRYKFLLTLSSIFQLKILHQIESLLEKYNNEYNEYVQEIMSIMIRTTFSNYNKSFKSKYSKGINFDLLNGDLKNDSTLDNMIDQCLDLNTKNKNSEECSKNEDNIEIQEKNTDEINHIPFKNTPCDIFSIDDIAPILQFTVKNFPSFLVTLISDLHLSHLWPIVTNNLSEKDLLDLFKSQKEDIESLITYNERYIKEMYFALCEEIMKSNNTKNDLFYQNQQKSEALMRIILSKLPIYDSYDVLIDLFKRNCTESIIIEYIRNIIDESVDIQKYSLILKIIIALLTIKSFKQEESLKSLFEILNNQTFKNHHINVLKYEIFVLLSKNEQSIRLVQSIVQLIDINSNEEEKIEFTENDGSPDEKNDIIFSDKNQNYSKIDHISLSLKSLELMRSIEINEIDQYLNILVQIIIIKCAKIEIIYEIDILNTTVSLLFDTINNRLLSDTKMKEILHILMKEIQKILIKKEISYFNESQNLEGSIRDCMEHMQNTFIDFQEKIQVGLSNMNVEDTGVQEKNQNQDESHSQKSDKSSQSDLIDSKSAYLHNIDRIQVFILSIIENTVNLLLSKHTLRMDVPFYCFIVKLYQFYHFIRKNDIVLIFLKNYKYDRYLRLLLIKEIIKYTELIDKRVLGVLIHICGDTHKNIFIIEDIEVDEYIINEILKYISNYRTYLIEGSELKNSLSSESKYDTKRDQIAVNNITKDITQSMHEYLQILPLKESINIQLNITSNNEPTSMCLLTKDELNQLILKVCSILPCENVIPFYLKWLPNTKINQIIGDGSVYKKESFEKILKVRLNWEDKIELVQQLEVKKESINVFIMISKEIIKDGYRAVNEYFDDDERIFYHDSNQTCDDLNSLECPNNSEKDSRMKSTSTTIQKEALLIEYIKKYMSCIKSYECVESNTLDVIFMCCEAKKRCMNLSLFCYHIVIEEYQKYLKDDKRKSMNSNKLNKKVNKNQQMNKNVSELDTRYKIIDRVIMDDFNRNAIKSTNSNEMSISGLLKIRIKIAIQTFIFDLIKYEQLSDKCKRDEVLFILKMLKNLVVYEKKSIKEKNVDEEKLICESLMSDCIELLKLKDNEIIYHVYDVLKEKFN